MLVCAPTGAGKTVVGEFAVHLALARRAASASTPRRSRRCPTRSTTTWSTGTAPEQVGLLTGDNAINGDAPVVVMTTEVLRNMLYAGSGALDGLGYVVMDEVHYLADRFRGAVWEEVIIHLPGVGHAGLAVGDGEQRRGVRRLAGHRPRRHRGGGQRAPAGAAVAAHAGRHADVRPVPRRRRGPASTRCTRSCCATPGSCCAGWS